MLAGRSCESGTDVRLEDEMRLSAVVSVTRALVRSAGGISAEQEMGFCGGGVRLLVSLWKSAAEYLFRGDVASVRV